MTAFLVLLALTVVGTFVLVLGLCQAAARPFPAPPVAEPAPEREEAVV